MVIMKHFYIGLFSLIGLASPSSAFLGEPLTEDYGAMGLYKDVGKKDFSKTSIFYAS